MNVNEVWRAVQEKYPDAVFEYWFSTGELIFYKHKNAENPSSCYVKDGKLTFTDDF